MSGNINREIYISFIFRIGTKIVVWGQKEKVLIFVKSFYNFKGGENEWAARTSNLDKLRKQKKRDSSYVSASITALPAPQGCFAGGFVKV